MNPAGNWGDNLVLASFLLLPLVSAGLLLWLARFARRTGRRKHGAVVAGANLLVLVLLISTLVAAGETWFRFAVDTTDSFGRTRVNQRWFQRHWNLNREGFRDSLSVYPPARSPDGRRITFLGDSFTAGHGVANVEDRFPNRIRAHSRSEVHVLADLGYDTGHDLQILQGLIAQEYELDEVVLAYNLNDVGDISPQWKSVVERIESTPPPGFLIRHSFFLDTCYYRLKGRFDPDISNYCQSMLRCYDGPLWQEQQDRLKKLRGLVEAHGGHLLVVTFPFLQHLGPGYEYRAVHARLGQFWEELGVPHLDLLGLFETHRDQTLTVNAHDAHPNVRAHALAAEAIRGFVEKNAREPQAATTQPNRN